MLELQPAIKTHPRGYDDPVPHFDSSLFLAPSSARITGKERDAESGLDYFIARYYSGAQGRFTSPDEPFAGWDQHDPQSFNLYNYTSNNPLNRIDPDGHDVRVCVDDQGNNKCFTLSDEQYRDLYAKQNSQQGIALPGGRFPAGDITCGGNKCGSAQYFEPGLEDATGSFLIFAEGARAAFGLARFGFQSAMRFFSRDAAEEGGVAIGKMADLNAPGALRAGERQLDLPNLIEPKANWAQNSSKLREIMAEGRPIRDVSAEPVTGGRLANNTGFLRAERNLLENHGWTYRNGYWFPPGK
jgi:RHS repeat-associated protein